MTTEPVEEQFVNQIGDHDDIWSIVDNALLGIGVNRETGFMDVIVSIETDEIVEASRALRDDEDANFNYLRSLTAVDNMDDGMEVVYHLYSTTKKHNVTVKVFLSNESLRLPTVTDVWPAANWLEREVAEMFGIKFSGHPDPRNLLMPEEIDDAFPLRKDHPLAEIEVLQGEGMGYSGEEL
jgi:NADH:ubiquinone oxidoreductase subunit C|tara:strand:- start:1336 stop:1878 length:543 start_codon:yes stop_codon:yes gene_type:complete